MKKWISAVIAFAMLLSLSCPVFAERLLKPIEEAAPAAVEVEDETPVIPEEQVPTAAAPTVALTAAEYELGYVNMATAVSYTHLDVYKRQGPSRDARTASSRREAAR